MVANRDLLDASIRHQVHVRRLASREAREVLELLEKADAELATMLRKRLRQFEGRPPDFTSKRFLALMQSIREQRSEVMKHLRRKVREDMVELAKIEADWETRAIKESIPVEIDMATTPVPTLRAVVTSKPFAGGRHSARTLAQWFQSLEMGDRRRLRDAIQLGIAQGETVDQMVRRIAGTRAAKFRDGVLAISRRGAETAVRTATNHVSNDARRAVHQENADIVRAEQWVSTLDGRTTSICQARDGRFRPIGDHELPPGVPKLDPPDAEPPAHPGCRSTMIAVLNPEGIERKLPNRPMVRDTRTRRRREKDFRQDAKAKVGKERWSEMDESQRRAEIRKERQRWTAENVGQVEGKTTYQEFLTRQPDEFVEDVLGKTKARLFRRGDLSVDQFVDAQGKEMTLAELARQRPEAFSRAGLEPKDFR